MRILLSSLFFCIASQAAYAGKCDVYTNQIAKQSGSQLIATFKRTYQCDKAVAEHHFVKFINNSMFGHHQKIYNISDVKIFKVFPTLFVKVHFLSLSLKII